MPPPLEEIKAFSSSLCFGLGVRVVICLLQFFSPPSSVPHVLHHLLRPLLLPPQLPGPQSCFWVPGVAGGWGVVPETAAAVEAAFCLSMVQSKV